jgi:hypothetical protein
MRLVKRPTLIIEKVAEPKVDKDDKFNEILKKKEFQRNIYKDFLLKFIEEHCTYEYQHMETIEDVKKSYAKFINDNNDYVRKYNCSFSLTPSDISKLDNRFEYVCMNACKHCKKKQFVDCCDKYNKSHEDRTKLIFFVNLKLV